MSLPSGETIGAILVPSPTVTCLTAPVGSAALAGSGRAAPASPPARGRATAPPPRDSRLRRLTPRLVSSVMDQTPPQREVAGRAAPGQLSPLELVRNAGVVE